MQSIEIMAGTCTHGHVHALSYHIATMPDGHERADALSAADGYRGSAVSPAARRGHRGMGGHSLRAASRASWRGSGAL